MLAVNVKKLQKAFNKSDHRILSNPLTTTGHW